MRGDNGRRKCGRKCFENVHVCMSSSCGLWLSAWSRYGMTCLVWVMLLVLQPVFGQLKRSLQKKPKKPQTTSLQKLIFAALWTVLKSHYFGDDLYDFGARKGESFAVCTCQTYWSSCFPNSSKIQNKLEKCNVLCVPSVLLHSEEWIYWALNCAGIQPTLYRTSTW